MSGSLPKVSVEDDEIVLSVSTAFYPGARSLESDITVSSCDGVLFYLHSAIIAEVSPPLVGNLFRLAPLRGGHVSDATVIPLPLSAITLTIIFHTIYGSSCAPHSPTTADLVAAVDTMPCLGVIPSDLIKPCTPLYTLLLSHAPLSPMDVYSLAAHHHLTELAKQVSSHLLAYPIETIDDDLTKRIGVYHLKRLFVLIMTRDREAKEILKQPPGLHLATKTCRLENQRRVTRAWAIGSTQLAWDKIPDLSTHRLQSVFNPLIEQLACKDCQEVMRNRMKESALAWAAVQTTI